MCMYTEVDKNIYLIYNYLFEEIYLKDNATKCYSISARWITFVIKLWGFFSVFFPHDILNGHFLRLLHSSIVLQLNIFKRLIIIF